MAGLAHAFAPAQASTRILLAQGLQSFGKRRRARTELKSRFRRTDIDEGASHASLAKSEIAVRVAIAVAFDRVGCRQCGQAQIPGLPLPVPPAGAATEPPKKRRSSQRRVRSR